MGTRGAFGVIIGEREKIGYNQMDSYPDGHGVENLRWVREQIEAGNLAELRAMAELLRVVADEKPAPEDIERLAPWTNLGVSEQSTDDWYCLTREAHGSLAETLKCGYVEDSSAFPLDSLSCEWAYVVDFDVGVFEAYKGFQKTRPAAGRWAGRPTDEEDAEQYRLHVEWCKQQDPPRDPWLPEVSEYKAVALIASWPLDALPSDQEFVVTCEPPEGEEEEAA